MNSSSADGESSLSLIKWIKQPTSWLSVIATLISISTIVISIATFRLVYADRGEVKVVMPDRVGIKLWCRDAELKRPGDADLLIPLTFTNTGAPRTVQHVTRVTAILSNIYPSKVLGNKEVDLGWSYEYMFVSRQQWFQKYPNEKGRTAEKTGSCDREDYLDYLNRAVPFAIWGGTSAYKLSEFIQIGNGFQQSVRGFDLVVRAEVDHGSPPSSEIVKYECESDQLKDSKFRYCERRR